MIQRCYPQSSTAPAQSCAQSDKNRFPVQDRDKTTR
jgi:hypothetical protein